MASIPEENARNHPLSEVLETDETEGQAFPPPMESITPGWSDAKRLDMKIYNGL